VKLSIDPSAEITNIGSTGPVHIKQVHEINGYRRIRYRA
jgi:hypothetical protein